MHYTVSLQFGYFITQHGSIIPGMIISSLTTDILIYSLQIFLSTTDNYCRWRQILEPVFFKISPLIIVHRYRWPCTFTVTRIFFSMNMLRKIPPELFFKSGRQILSKVHFNSHRVLHQITGLRCPCASLYMSVPAPAVCMICLNHVAVTNALK